MRPNVGHNKGFVLPVADRWQVLVDPDLCLDSSLHLRPIFPLGVLPPLVCLKQGKRSPSRQKTQLHLGVGQAMVESTSSLAAPAGHGGTDGDQTAEDLSHENSRNFGSIMVVELIRCSIV
jgi:hypothetical protein